MVLRYIEQHEDEYNSVLWIDVRSEDTAQASYERCCRELGLSVEATLRNGPVQDVPAVQSVLSWLRSRGNDKRWLVVVDNADDMSWDVSSIVPKGKAGTVIVTSQDAQASRLLGGRTPMVRVDAMEPEEAVHLVMNYFDGTVCLSDGCLALVKEITECLDWLALATDLAGARVHVDVENGDDLATALPQYLADYRQNQDELLRDEEFARTGTYKKTVWTAWETSLASLRKVEDSQPDIYPIQLLSFVTLLDRTNVQDELFRIAGLGIEEACRRLNVEVPTWMQGLLGKVEPHLRNDFSYRASVKLLLRYGLVRPVSEPWKGITMHNLVQWRAGAAMDLEQYWLLYFAFIAAVCATTGKVAETVRFRRHLVVHLPSNERLLNETSGAEEEGLWWMWSQVGKVLWEEGRWKEAEELGVKVMEARQTAGYVGEEHPETITAMANVAATYWNQGRWTEAEELDIKVMEARSRVLGEEHPDTITAMANLASTYSKQGRSKEAEDLEVKVIVARRKLLGEEHPDTLSAIANLAATYWNQGRWKEAEEFQVKVMEASSSVLGKEHPDTLTAIANLAVTYSIQGDEDKAEGLKVKVIEARQRVKGEEHPETLTAIVNLAITYRKQGRWKEAEDLGTKAMEVSLRVLGKEHPDTLTTIADLAATYRNQGRTKEAEELEVKVLEARQRVLGEDHPGTIGAMANLAYTKRDLGQNAVAIDLMTQSATASSRVLGSDHPDCKSRYKQLTLW